MDQGQREIKVISQKDLIALLSKKLDLYKSSVSFVLKGIEEVVLDEMLKADVNHDVEIRLFNGMKFTSYYIPSHEGYDPRNHSPIVVDAKLKCGVKLSDNLRKKLRDKSRIKLKENMD